MQYAFLPATPLPRPGISFHARSRAPQLPGAAPGADPSRAIPSAQISLPRAVSTLLAAIPTFFSSPNALPQSFHHPASPPSRVAHNTSTHVRNSKHMHGAIAVVSNTSTKTATGSSSPRAKSTAVATASVSSSKLAAIDAAIALPTRPNAPPPISFQDRINFYWGEYLMWNPGARVLALLAFTLSTMYFGSFLYRLADPKGTEAEYPFWHAVRAIANPLEDDWTKNSLRATSIVLASVGMVVFAILVGMVTESVESAVQSADGDNSPVVVSDHVLICGWGSHVSQVIKDVGTVTPNLKVVVLASPEHKEQMISEMRTTMTEQQRRNLRVFYRPGAPVIADDLNRVGASRARKILLVNPQFGLPVDADRFILSQALALRQNIPSFSGDIVAELHNSRDEGILRSIMTGSHASSVETVNAEQLLFRFMAQAIRQPGLAEVVAQLMGDDVKSVFHVASAKDAAPGLVGTNFKDLRPTSVPGSILCGFFSKDGTLLLENGSAISSMGETIEADTKILLLGARRTTDSNVKFPQNSSEARSFKIAPSTSSRQRPESYVVCGWRSDMQYMLHELDTMLPKGSQITIIDEDVPGSALKGVKNIRVKMVRQRADRYETLQRILGPNCKPVDHVVILGSALGHGQEAVHVQTEYEDDSKTLATLVYVNDLLSRQQGELKEGRDASSGPRTMVTTEFTSDRVADMARDHGNIANAILPQNLRAKIAAQTVRDSRLNAVWRELLSQYGREVYLRPCSDYANVSGERKSFASVADSLAVSDDDIVIGYIPRFVSKVNINPQDGERFKARTWNENDTLIVLSKE